MMANEIPTTCNRLLASLHRLRYQTKHKSPPRHSPIMATTRAAMPWSLPPVGLDSRDPSPTFKFLTLRLGAGPGPGTVIRNQKRISHPIPKSRSPPKTYLKSPARKNPHVPSPSRPSVDRNLEVSRKINFQPTGGRTSNENQPRRPSFLNGGLNNNDDDDDVDGDDYNDDSDNEDAGLAFGDYIDIDGMVNQSTQMAAAKRTDPLEPDYQGANDYRPAIPPSTMSAKAQGKQKATPAKPTKDAASRFPVPSDNDYDDPGPEPTPEPEPEPVFEPEPEPEPSPPPRPHAPPKQKIPPQPTTQQSPRRHDISRKRTPAAASITSATRGDGDADYRQTSKRPRTESVASKPEPPKRGRGRPPKNGPAKRPRGRPRKSETERDADQGESLFMALQRGPPMPKSRGLVSVRHGSHNTTNTRRGYSRPADDLLPADDYGYNYDDYDETSAPTNTRQHAPSTHRRHQPPSQPQEEPEAWEEDPGTITGEIVLWEPEHETQPPADDDPVQVTDERVAIAASAIETTEIRDSAVRFAKTLATPFMGAGVVDLPPGSEKRPKNSRKMHMVFVVHYGKVTVTINEAQFRISAGGMWFVPRGNYYSIVNESEAPSRVYFSQACEVAPVYEEVTQSILE